MQSQEGKIKKPRLPEADLQKNKQLKTYAFYIAEKLYASRRNPKEDFSLEPYSDY